MRFWLGLVMMVVILWTLAVIVMLPAYFWRKYKNEDTKKETIKSLLIKSLIASAIFTLVFYSGLIAMYYR